MLVTVASAQWLHFLHPEVISQRANVVHGLFERVLDFEAQSVQTDDVGGTQLSIGAHE
jgi:hypothetical protein